MPQFDRVLATRIAPAAPAPRAVAISPSQCARKCDDVGATMIGCGISWPKSFVRVSIFETSTITFGFRRICVSASAFQRIVFSSADPLLMYSQAARVNRWCARISYSASEAGGMSAEDDEDLCFESGFAGRRREGSSPKTAAVAATRTMGLRFARLGRLGIEERLTVTEGLRRCQFRSEKFTFAAFQRSKGSTQISRRYL